MRQTENTDLMLLGEIEKQASDFACPFTVPAKAVGADLNGGDMLVIVSI